MAEKFTHICHTMCRKHAKTYRPGDKITLRSDEDSRWFTPIPQAPARPDPPVDAAGLVITEEDLHRMTKAQLETYAMDRFGVEIDRRHNNKDIVAQILRLEERISESQDEV